MGITEILIIAWLVIALPISIYKTAKIRRANKERVNREFHSEVELTAEEHQSRIGEIELMYEDLEETYWAHIGALCAIIAHLYWHNWYATVLMGVSIIFIGYKFLTIRPFTTGIPD